MEIEKVASMDEPRQNVVAAQAAPASAENGKGSSEAVTPPPFLALRVALI
jgi:hypothetical protein